MNLKYVCIFAGIILLLGIPSFWPYSYYILLRWVIFLVGLYIAYNCYKIQNYGWALIIGVIGLAFNPIFPIYLNKSTWVIIDFISALLFFTASYQNVTLTKTKGKEVKVEGVELILEKEENFFKRFYHKHETYFTSIYQVAFVIGYIYGIIVLLRNIFDSLRSGNFLSFVISIIFSSVIMMFTGLIVGLLLGTFLALVLFIPYLVIRGLRN